MGSKMHSRTLYCIVCGRSDIDLDITNMFCFPRNPKKAQLWFEKMNINCTASSVRSFRICNIHFTKDSFTNEFCFSLNRNAIPLLLPAKHITTKVEVEDEAETSSSTPIKSEPIEEDIDQCTENINQCTEDIDQCTENNIRGVMGPKMHSRTCYCIVCGRSDTDLDVTNMFYFPRNPNKARLWLEKMNINCTGTIRSFRICNQHFTKDSFANEHHLRLNRNAIPLLLPAKPVSPQAGTSCSNHKEK